LKEAQARLALVSQPVSDSSETLPLGSACVAAAIRATADLASLEPFLLEAEPGESPAGLASRLAASGARLVGLSVYSWSRGFLCEAARLLRAESPGTFVFAGGPEASADPEGLIAEAGLDFAIAGEGEAATVNALQALLSDRLEEGGIPGLVLPGRPWHPATLENAADLPSPWISGTIDPRAYGGDLLWELSRGCPFRCAYCYESKGRGGSRPFPMARIEAELELIGASGAKYVFVLDPTFDADRDRAAALLELLRAKPGIRWKFELRAELLDKELARRFAALDCLLQIGLQSVNPATLDAIGRPGFDRKAFARKIALLGSAGLSFGLDLIYGLPGDSLRDFEEGLDYALGLGPNHLDIFPLAVLPGTELFERAAALGLEADTRPPYLVRSTRELPAADLERAASLALACDRFYSAGRAVGWFRAALAPLRSLPSAFLRGYAAWLSRLGEQGPRGSIEAEQLGFLEEGYRADGLDALLPALRDLVRLHGAWGRALAEGETTRLELSYEPEEALAAGAAGLAAFARAARPRRGSWRVVPDAEEGARIERGR
jgi:radical SAM superfamily enzyme YgiQ (UPF0313 family)